MEQMTYVNWYVVFTNQDVGRHWIHKFIKKPYYHCYCFCEMSNCIMMVDTSKASIRPIIYGGLTAFHMAKELSETEDTTVLFCQYPFDFNNRIFSIWNMAPTCVNITKMILGIKAKAQTPYQLFKYLVNKGAYIIKR